MNRRSFLSLLSSLPFMGFLSQVSQSSPYKETLKGYKNLRWGTYGKDACHELRWVKLGDCSTGHLQAILRTQWQIDALYKRAIKAILHERQSDAK